MPSNVQTHDLTEILKLSIIYKQLNPAITAHCIHVHDCRGTLHVALLPVQYTWQVYDLILINKMDCQNNSLMTTPHISLLRLWKLNMC